MSILYDKRS
jgi:hypothetical protein